MRILILLLALLWGTALQADTAAQIVAANAAQIEKPSRQTIEPVISSLASSGDPMAAAILQAWGNKALGQRKSDKAFFILTPAADGFTLTDLTGADAGPAAKSDITELKPNAGVRGLIESALVQFTLSDPDPAKRADALTSIARDPNASLLSPLRASIDTEADPALKSQKQRLERLLTLQFDPDSAARVTAIQSFGADLGLDIRGALNPLLTTKRVAAADLPAGANLAQQLRPGRDLTEVEAYDLLVTASLAPPRLTLDDQRKALAANIVGGTVGGIPVADLNDQSKRNAAYTALEQAGTVPTAATDDEVTAAVAAYTYYDIYAEPDPAVTDAAKAELAKIGTTVAVMQVADLTLDGISLASIYFLAAIGLAITFGVMGVINMAHGEFITMGAYTGFVVQTFIPNYTLSLLVAFPLAFAITFAAGVAMERLVIRHLYKRPLETLLASFGISIALQQLFKNIFGTQARPLTSPSWLDGALTFNDVLSISYIRIAIFVLALIFLMFFLYMMKRTRLGLEVRAVTQNPNMAASMGINPDRINMLTFGLGSGIAGIAGVAIGLFAKVTSELGTDYIVQSFMTVVVGGVGNIWGTLAGATMIGGLQKGIEWFNPSNTLAAQTYMILFIILFIQFRPRGIVALKGRAAGD
jgi:urea transport system permease protein